MQVKAKFSKMNITIRSFCFFFFLSLVGCSSTPPTPLSVDWQQHQIALEQLKNYQVRGKLGYKDEKQRQSLNFLWKQNAQSSQLILTTFLGQTVLKMDIDDHGAKVVTRDDKTYHHSSAAQLVYQLTGLNIPFSNLSDWLKGLPTNADNFTLTPEQTVAQLFKSINSEQWQLNYQAYEQAEQLPLPNKMQLSQGSTSLKIVISNWTTNP